MNRQNKSDYEVYRICKAMTAVDFTDSTPVTNNIIVGRSLLTISENMRDTKDNCILSFVIESNNKKK